VPDLALDSVMADPDAIRARLNKIFEDMFDGYAID
jgi:hypothetical protein